MPKTGAKIPFIRFELLKTKNWHFAKAVKESEKNVTPSAEI